MSTLYTNHEKTITAIIEKEEDEWVHYRPVGGKAVFSLPKKQFEKLYSKVDPVEETVDPVEETVDPVEETVDPVEETVDQKPTKRKSKKNKGDE